MSGNVILGWLELESESYSFGITGYEDEEPEIGLGQNIEQESMLNDSCSFWHITGDKYCFDEASIVECGYDF